MRFAVCLGLWLALLPVAAPAATLEEARTLLQAQRYEEADAVLRDKLTRNPELAEARYLLARSLSWQGRYDAAIVEYRTLLQAEPDNTDYMLGLAQCYVWGGHAQDALPVLEQAQTLNPDDAELWRLHIQALAALGPARHSDALTLQSAAAARFPQQAWQMVAEEPSVLASAPIPLQLESPVPADADRSFEPGNQAELSASRDRLSRDNASWQSLRLDAEHRFAPRTLVYGALTETKRFGLYDYEVLGGFYYPLTPRLTLNAEASYNPEHNVLPQTTARAGLQYAFNGGWVLSGAVRQAEYDDASVTQLPLSLERYFGAYRIAYSPTPTFVDGDMLDNHSLQFSYYYDDISALNLSYSRGQEATQIGTRFVTTKVETVAVGGRHWFSRDWAMTWELAYTEQGNFYDRTGLRLGIRRAF